MRIPGFWHNGRFYPPIRGGSGEGETPPPGDTGAGGTTASGGSTTVTPPPPRNDELVFANQQVLGQRLGRERRGALDDLATKYGFPSHDEMEAALGRTKEQREKEQGEAATLREQLKTAQTQASDAQAQVQRMALRHAVESEALSLGFHNPEDAFALADFAEVKITDGAADRATIKAQLNALGRQRPYLLKAPLKDGQQTSGTTTQTNGTAAGSGDTSVPVGEERGVMINGVPVIPRAPIPTRSRVDAAGRDTPERRKEIAAKFPFLAQRGNISGRTVTGSNKP